MARRLGCQVAGAHLSTARAPYLCLALAGALTVPLAVAAAPMVEGTAVAATVPGKARAVDTSRPDRWIGTGTARSCTSRAVVRAVARAGSSGSRRGPDPVRIEMGRTAKVINTSRRVVLDGRGLVTLSGGGNAASCIRTPATGGRPGPRRIVMTRPRLALSCKTYVRRRQRDRGDVRRWRGRRHLRARWPAQDRALDVCRQPLRRDGTGPRRRRRPGALAAPRAAGDRRSQHLPLRGLQQRRRSEQHRRVVVDLQQRLHRQPSIGRGANPRARTPPAAARAAPSMQTATTSAY